MIDNQQISLLDVKTQNSVAEQMIDIMNKMAEKLLSIECIYCDKIKSINIREDIHHPIDYYCAKLIKKEELLVLL